MLAEKLHPFLVLGVVGEGPKRASHWLYWVFACSGVTFPATSLVLYVELHFGTGCENKVAKNIGEVWYYCITFDLTWLRCRVPFGLMTHLQHVVCHTSDMYIYWTHMNKINKYCVCLFNWRLINRAPYRFWVFRCRLCLYIIRLDDILQTVRGHPNCSINKNK